MREKNGFSLMEMMVVLLIMSIIAAATAPIVSKKMMQSSKSNASPWVFTGQGKNIAYNMGGLDNATAIIGAAKVPEGTNARLYIDCGNNASQIALGSGDTAANILADPVGKRVGIFSANSNVNVPNDSVAIGMNQALSGNGLVSLGSNVTSGNYGSSIGYGAQAGEYSIAIGSSSKAALQSSVAIGNGASVERNYGFAGGAKAVAGNSATAIGTGAYANGQYSVAIGGSSSPDTQGAYATGTSSVAIGGIYGSGTAAKAAKASGSGSLALGAGAQAGGADGSAIAIGPSASATGWLSIAEGITSKATANYSIALGWNSQATHDYSVAIGPSARTTTNDQIVLGGSGAADPNLRKTVYIPGNLVVGGYAYFGADATMGQDGGVQRLPIFVKADNSRMVQLIEPVGSDNHIIHDNEFHSFSYSDKRLKNIGEKFTAGLDELKKLDFFHYTFKKDEAKTPHVGVIAQDLQKVFPDAVTKGEDGYLKIRFEDMFYAVINAIKELDNKINNIIAKNDEQDKTIESQQAKIDKLQETIEAQQKTIEELLKQNEEIISRLKKSE